jgi:hypothetical protein
MLRILLALLTSAALIVGIAPSAGATTCCATQVEFKPCKGVKRCVWGGDPDSAFIEVRAATKKTALARAAKVVKNIKSAKVTPRSFDVHAFKGRKRVLAKTHKLKGPHWYYSDKQECWYVK